MSYVILLTGVSAAGKTTTAKQIHQLVSIEHDLADRFSECIILDGDIMRQLWPDLGFSTADRQENVKRIAMLTGTIVRQTFSSLVIVSAIMPTVKSRKWFWDIVDRIGSPFSTTEVLLHAPLEERIERDPKGLYARAMAGEIEELTGYDGLYEVGEHTTMLDTSKLSPYQTATKILQVV